MHELCDGIVLGAWRQLMLLVHGRLVVQCVAGSLSGVPGGSVRVGWRD